MANQELLWRRWIALKKYVKCIERRSDALDESGFRFSIISWYEVTTRTPRDPWENQTPYGEEH